jgi:hypothetical protein
MIHVIQPYSESAGSGAGVQKGSTPGMVSSAILDKTPFVDGVTLDCYGSSDEEEVGCLWRQWLSWSVSFACWFDWKE